MPIRHILQGPLYDHWLVLPPIQIVEWPGMKNNLDKHRSRRAEIDRNMALIGANGLDHFDREYLSIKAGTEA